MDYDSTKPNHQTKPTKEIQSYLIYHMVTWSHTVQEYRVVWSDDECTEWRRRFERPDHTENYEQRVNLPLVSIEILCVLLSNTESNKYKQYE